MLVSEVGLSVSVTGVVSVCADNLSEANNVNSNDVGIVDAVATCDATVISGSDAVASVSSSDGDDVPVDVAGVSVCADNLSDANNGLSVSSHAVDIVDAFVTCDDAAMSGSDALVAGVSSSDNNDVSMNGGIVFRRPDDVSVGNDDVAVDDVGDVVSDDSPNCVEKSVSDDE